MKAQIYRDTSHHTGTVSSPYLVKLGTLEVTVYHSIKDKPKLFL